MTRMRFGRWPAFGVVLLASLALVVGAAAADPPAAPNVTESVAVGDAVGTVAGASSSVGENVQPGDAVATVSGARSSIAESVVPSDQVTLTPGRTLAVGEAVAPNDSVGFTQGQLLQLTDGVTPTDAVSGEIVNTKPTLVLPGAFAILEGGRLSGTGSFVDPDTQHWTATVDWGDGTPVEPLVLALDKTFALDHRYDDNATGGYSVLVSLSDGLAATTGTIHVEVANVAPTANVSNDGPVAEGSAATISFAQQLDPSNADTAAGFTYAYDCGHGYATPTSAASSPCTFDDQGTYPVKATIFDKDGGSIEYSTDVVVTNVAPTATFAASASVAEGSAATLTFTAPFDPSNADVAAGFTYAYDCGSGYGAAASIPSGTCSFDDGPSTHLVRGTIFDKDGGATEYTATVAVTNVAPTAVLDTPAPVNEGSAGTVTVSGQSDPSHADTAAGFLYAFACDGATFPAATSSPSTTCTYDDGPSTHAVHVRIFDKDGGSTEMATTFTVLNVAPTATFTAPATVPEGSPIALALSAPSDPSTTDTAAGFTYAFDCGEGAGLGPFSATPTASCSTTDNGVRAVHGAIRDKDGGVTTYDASVTVTNVAPTATLVVPASANEGSTFAISLTGPVDPSSTDTAAGFTYAFDCGTGYGPPSSLPTANCTAVNDPGADVRATITDKDGGSTEYAAHVAIVNLPPTVQITAPAALSAYPIGTTVSFAGSFTDAGILDTHTAHWSFDASGTPGAVTESNGAGVVSGSFTFTVAGVYSVALAVTDNAGGTGTATTVGGSPALVVVFDPNVGKVTGGGWVPAGSAKTTFNVNAKYNHGALTGNLGAQLPDGRTMSSTTLRWLVTVGSKAEVAGDATLNGVAGYTFLVTVSDTSAYRLKLTRASDGVVVYDNVPGSSDDIDLATPQPAGGGNITLH
jgi:hypothetical protein